MASSLVLVVEEQLLRRAHAVDALREVGFEVVGLGDAVTPSEPWDQPTAACPGRPDLQMPGLRDGLDLAILLRSLYPQVEVIVPSSVFGGGKPEACVRFVPRPFMSRRPLEIEPYGERELQRVLH